MAQARVNPTRMELTRLKKRLTTASRGHKLLKDKRDEMIRQFVILARENMELRKRVEEKLSAALYDFLLARAVMSEDNLLSSLLYPAKQVELKLGRQNIMSVDVPKIEVASITEAEGGIPYGFAFTSAEMDGAIATLAEVLPELIALAEKEKSTNLLADEIEKTRRRVNALEYVLIPQMEENIRYISMKLEENERANLTRLMKVKDMIAARDEASRQELDVGD
ncbi:V-type ATP synthase subunit D [Eubacteriales bacterium OttesenSCG-928-M02]|nr:V-type ATP synthase subunit D [Eubacteriales bacterium OttesenSCG-928-M02]